MLEQYKKTFIGTQLVIATVTVATYLGLGHVFVRSAVFFSMMQIGAVVGAVWAVRLRKKFQRQTW
jgi:hypothetical protein